MLKELNKFREEFMGKYYFPMSSSRFGSLKRKSRVLAIKDKNEVAGLIVLTLSESLTRRALVIEDIIIDKKHRGNGLGSKAMKEVTKLAERLKADCIEVQTKKTNKIAQNFYKKFGFKNRNQISYRLWIKRK